MAKHFSNTASVTYGYGNNHDKAVSNITSATVVESHTIQGYMRSLNKSFRPGQNITLLVHIENNGKQPIYAVSIKDITDQDAGLSFVEGSGSMNLNGTVTQMIPVSENPISFLVPNVLNPGDKVSIIFVVKVANTLDQNSISYSMEVVGHKDSENGDLMHLSDELLCSITKEDYASISISKLVNSNVISEGEPFSSILTLENSGNVDAQNVVITDILPKGFVMGSVSVFTDGIMTSLEENDYLLDQENHTLTLPGSSALSITVPAASGGIKGKTVITITGTISL